MLLGHWMCFSLSAKFQVKGIDISREKREKLHYRKNFTFKTIPVTNHQLVDASTYSEEFQSQFIFQFCGVLGHTFMEFLKGSGDYCQAQHDLYADK